jgi:hypothetical protein
MAWDQVLRELEASHRTKLDDASREMYLNHLSILSLEQFQSAVEMAAQVCRHFPSIADLFELAGIDPPKVQAEREAEAEWRTLRSGSKPLHELTLKNISLKIVSEMGGRGDGPLSFGRWAPDQERFKKKEFTTRYVELKREMEAQDIRPAKAVTHVPFDLTPQERLEANRASFEVARQAEEGRRSGRNCWDAKKVLHAQFISDHDEAIFAKYGRHGENVPTPAKIFGNIGHGVIG